MQLHIISPSTATPGLQVLGAGRVNTGVGCVYVGVGCVYVGVGCVYIGARCANVLMPGNIRVEHRARVLWRVEQVVPE